ncbi:uncharacterized protein LOC116208501 [Punica granatum]|uniref:Uncharacterized protein LOC116208501 n=1 Tax=Punica granatum TaxID=22663 RepID=A0A218X6X7_PUNGR|nr:uncharacterized protein LOC116208501 [Punica granatum]XP_031397855.1 uncharacterized protein LOC116208501 [Punica granatum]OWM81005.1 hypothetical protein CDL15_Pgr007036 [Punica granatum]
MAKLSCFSLLTGRKKKGNEEKAKTTAGAPKALLVRLDHPVKPFETDELKHTSFKVPVPLGINQDAEFNVKVTVHESPISGAEAPEIAYEGEDEQEEMDKDHSSIRRDYSDFDLQAREREAALDSEEFDLSGMGDADVAFVRDSIDLKIQSGHVSDPGVRKTEFWASPTLKRSCSNLEISEALKRAAGKLSPPSKSQSFEELQALAHNMTENANYCEGSPVSVNSHFSADKVMLKKHSSSQVLPSRSRRLWWKLFLWSHRNSHKKFVKPRPVPVPIPALAALNQRGGGYSSDTLEPSRAMKFKVTELPPSFDGHSPSLEIIAAAGLWPQNQWVAFTGESSSSPLARVDEWVKDLSIEPTIPDDDYNGENGDEDNIIFPPSPETARGSAHHLVRHPETNLGEEILHANSLIQSLNSSSSVAHISGVGLKVLPTLSRFSSLKSVNLSSNSIVRITSGSLPKGLHVLNLSRNKIGAIEGLRELTRLRILDLSYNRIARIGHGLSNCTLIKELYLGGNKISEIEGLHRMLKLTVLDLSFNKITTNKSLGQLVANYNSLLALNLLGNPIQSNISDEQLRKAVCGLLPRLVYLNKQPLKQQRARELVTDSVAKAALGTRGGRALARRKLSVKRAGPGGSGHGSIPSTSGVHKRSETSRQKKGKGKANSHSRSHSHPRLP